LPDGTMLPAVAASFGAVLPGALRDLRLFRYLGGGLHPATVARLGCLPSLRRDDQALLLEL